MENCNNVTTICCILLYLLFIFNPWHYWDITIYVPLARRIKLSPWFYSQCLYYCMATGKVDTAVGATLCTAYFSSKVESSLREQTARNLKHRIFKMFTRMLQQYIAMEIHLKVLRQRRAHPIT